MKSFIDGLKLAFFLRDPTPEENIQQLRSVAQKVVRFSPYIASNLRKMADAEEQALKEPS